MRNFGFAKSRMLSGFFVGMMMSGLSLGQVLEGKTANTLDRVNSTISKAASEHQQSPLPRMIAFDLAFASTEGEADALKDNAVLLVTMITRTEKERPIKEALVVRDSQKYKLVNLNSFWYSIKNQSPELIAFGEFRQDSLFLLPLKLISTESSLDVQLGNDGQVVHLGNLQSLPSNFVQRQRSPDEMSQVKIPELKTLAVREFPTLPLNATKVRVSSGVANAMLVKKVNPVYPQDAKDNRIQGAVVMKLTIGKDGGIKDLQLISGHPALSPAAIETVKKWEFKPYLLQGEPVEVETSVTINFTLSR